MGLKQLVFGIQAIVAAALLVLLFRKFDWSAFQSAFAPIPLHFYVASFGILAAGQALYVFKWQVVLNAMGLRLRFWDLAELYLLGTFFNNFLPTMIGGDAARVYYLGRQHGYTTIATSVFVDRGLGFLSTAAWGSALVWWLDITTPAFVIARQALTVLGIVLAVVVVAGLTMRLAPLVAVLRRVSSMRRIAEGVELVRKRGRPLRRRPAALGVVLVTSFLYLLVLVAIAVLSNIPISLNGIGLREQLHYLLFGSLGVSKELAVGISLIVFSQFLILSVLGGLVWLRQHAQDEE